MQVRDTDVADTIEKLNQKYSARKKQFRASENKTPGPSDEEAPKDILVNMPKRPSKELECYEKALHELLKAVANRPECDSRLVGYQDLSPPLQDSQGLFTEADVTLPSCLNVSSGSTLTDWQLQRGHQLAASCHSSSLSLTNVYQEMMAICEQLKTERQSQQQREIQLQEQERRLKQQRETFASLTGLDDMLHTQMLALEEKHRQELSQLQDLLRERSKENRRLKSSFDTIKELNDNMKQQLNKISEQNKKLESQYKRVQARLENLLRKYEQGMALRDCVTSSECNNPSKKEKPAVSGKSSNKGTSNPTSLKLLALLMGWVLDGTTFSSLTRSKDASHCLPPEVILNESCLKMLPLLADQIHHSPISEPELLLNLLRLIHWTLRHMDSSAQHVALSSSLRRIGEGVSKHSIHFTVCQSEDPDLPRTSIGVAGRACRSWPLYRNPCPHTRILSTLIILRTVTQVDVLAQALDTLHTELMSVESRGLFIHYEGVCVLLSMLLAGRGGLNTPIDILMQLTEESRQIVICLKCPLSTSSCKILIANPTTHTHSFASTSDPSCKTLSNRHARLNFFENWTSKF
ncbi:coiled-coil domain-containing protein 138-like isoform X2 [Antennarius striatus]|uniref:coiled-coil domain-containing protein 138-like isoform X2 n=1 Tax=Antennarius striatus TaxID=241820 RepID=UPI0035B3573B